MRVLVTGGAGYIGSHAVVQLIAAGHAVVILDNFCNAKPTVIDRLEQIVRQPLRVYTFDLREASMTEELLAEERIEAVVHFAGLKAVNESVVKPLEYYENNVVSTLTLLRAMQRRGVNRLVFSSSATVYGDSAEVPSQEDHPTSATNPYGWTKVLIEQILRDMAAADSLWRVAILRYFNPVGAHRSGTIGEDPIGKPNNLVPLIAQIVVDARERLLVYGDDYDTPDGTGVRDYVHVEDVAAAHVLALARLDQTEDSVRTWNLGTGRGTSVLEMIRAFERASGRRVPHEVVRRRPGDVAVAVADPHRANVELGWVAVRTVDEMCVDTLRWQERNRKGQSTS